MSWSCFGNPEAYICHFNHGVGTHNICFHYWYLWRLMISWVIGPEPWLYHSLDLLQCHSSLGLHKNPSVLLCMAWSSILKDQACCSKIQRELPSGVLSCGGGQDALTCPVFWKRCPDSWAPKSFTEVHALEFKVYLLHSGVYGLPEPPTSSLQLLLEVRSAWCHRELVTVTFRCYRSFGPLHGRGHKRT